MKSITINLKVSLRPFIFFLCGLVVLCFNNYSAYSQQTTSDLESMIMKLSEQLETEIKDSLQVYSNLHLTLQRAKEDKDTRLLAQSYTNLAIWHNGDIKIDSAAYYFRKAASIYNSSQSTLLEAETFLQLEDAYKQRGDYKQAMVEDFKALELYELAQNQQGIAKVYTRLCDILYYQMNYEKGAEYCQKAITILKILDAPEELSLSYRYKADNLLILERYDEALRNINNAILVLKEANFNEEAIAPSYNTRGNIYKYMKRYDDALMDYQRCYNLAKANNYSRGIITGLANIGHIYRIQEDYEAALPYSLEAIALMEQTGNTQNLSENYLHASDSYSGLGDFEKAYHYQRLHTEAEVKNLNTTINQLETELQIKYETAKKDETIEAQEAKIDRQQRIQLLYFGIAFLLAVILIGMYFTIKNNQKKRQALQSLNEQIKMNQKDLEKANTKLKSSIEELKSTQAQLIHSEKMASLGELTAGIAHEIQNPLNFVNNFSEVSTELLEEMSQELDSGEVEEAKAIAMDVKQNLEKITHHGKRADSIVKGMLQHSRNSSGEKEMVDINQLTDEYFRLAYHGLRAKEKSFNATLSTDFDSNLGKMNIVPQDFGRVLLNLITNAFYAVDEKQKTLNESKRSSYEPSVMIRTKKIDNSISIEIKDNGNGIPNDIRKKIFDPFFTTKPTGKGTGLGLSMSYDIIKAHGGRIEVDSEPGEFTVFKINLPIKTQSK